MPYSLEEASTSLLDGSHNLPGDHDLICPFCHQIFTLTLRNESTKLFVSNVSVGASSAACKMGT
jgi:hypothetical protein